MAVTKKTVASVEAETAQEVNEMIEGLETASETTTPESPGDISDFHASSGDDSMEETLGSLKGEESGDGPLGEEDGEKGGAQGGELTLSLTGDISLRLRYQIEGQDIVIGFKDHALQVRMNDGTEFKIPVRRSGLKLVG